MLSNKYLKVLNYILFSNIGLYWIESKLVIGYIQLFVGSISISIMFNGFWYLNKDFLAVILFLNIILWIIGIIEVLSKIDILLINE
jgi:hypothetical protein